MSPRLALRFLGPPQIHLENEPITLERRKALALLAYLAMEQSEHSRESLSALLWPDYSQSNAFKNLRQILWELQKTLGEDSFRVGRETVGLNRETGDVWLDIHEFDSRLTASRTCEDASLRIALLADSAKLYRNHFLTGFSLKDAHPFNDWAFAESEDLRQKFSIVLNKLSEEYCAAGQAVEAIPFARRLIALDPLNEAAHRQLMEVYLEAGQQSAALKQYQTCEQILRKELNLDPQPETRELYKRIRKGQAKPVSTEKRVEPSVPRHNLPHQLSTFIGREKERDAISQLIAKKRFVTLVGAGGIGKTSLALQVGQKLLTAYPNGVWFIALDSLSDPTLVPQTVASVFDIRENTDRPLLEKLIDSLQAKTALLIFDNCEHLLDACAELITTLLTHCPNIKVIATSRESIGIPGEAIYSMSPLLLPKQDAVSMETLAEIESVQLFADRATLALTSFQLTGANIQAVVDICRKVDGIPLGIELAAARVNIMQVGEILRQLQESFALLANNARTILPRHQTLQASMQWSWGLLSQAERSFLQQLSVFAGGWTLESARAVCDGEVLSLSSTLVKKSLIVVNQDTGRETRYRFHEIVREFAHDKLVVSGEEQKIRTKHLNYFVAFSAQAELELRGPSPMDWMERLHDDRNNLRGALHWAEKTDVEAGLHLSGRLRLYWESADLREGIHWLETFIHHPRSKDFPAAKARALHTYGWLLTWVQQFSRALTVTEESLALFRTAGDSRGEADTLVSLANIEQFLDEPDAALELLHQSLELARSLNDPWREANVYYFLGWDHRDFGRALRYVEKSLHLYRRAGDHVALANVLSVLGQFRALNGDVEMAEKHTDEALLLWRGNDRANIWENAKIAKSVIVLLRGEPEQAYTILEEALAAIRETGNRMSYLWVRVRMGHVALRAGNLEEARKILLETAQDFHKDGYGIGVVFALEGMADLYAATGKPQRAARLIGWADAMREKLSNHRLNTEQADVDKLITACLAKLGEVAFSDLYDEGQKMNGDEALAYAIGES